MKTYISILRGINVSGKNIIKMDELRRAFAELNFENIRTYIQSGNVVFNSKLSGTKNLEKKISKKILEYFGFNMPVIVKEITEITEVFNNNPFVNERNEGLNFLHVTFLSDLPREENLSRIHQIQNDSDEFIVSGKNIYLFCPNGYGNTKLSNTFFENKLNVSATTRNWKTISELINIAGRD
ncbi:MAG: DUF1697 domain-containing protein [Ignavibacteria bacterium]|nr:DUF1697 domain-containing protein [Ignavibacteria bacterium]